MVISILIWTMFGILISYMVVIGIITFGWMRIPIFVKRNIAEKIYVSIVVAIRNESSNLSLLIDSLTGQSYDSSLMEVIFVDDNSEDDSIEIINNYSMKSNVKIRVLESALEGKKNALKLGIEEAKSEFIITTDGDCSMGPNWISSLVDYYVSQEKMVISGPVVYSKERKGISNFFSADFSSLVASGAGSIGSSLPLMGNGANLAFNKEIYKDFDSKESISPSGDDVFLIHHAAKKYGYNSIGFIKSEDAIVSTLPPENISRFIDQRIRWASKAGGYKLAWPIIVSSVVFLFNLELFLILLCSLYYDWLLPVFGLLIITKYFIDFPLVYRYMNFAGISRLKPHFFLLELVYPIYINYIAVLSFFKKFRWKNRSY